MSDNKPPRISQNQVVPVNSNNEAATADADNEKKWECHRLGFFVFTALVEVVLLVLYGFFVEYSAVAAGNSSSHEEDIVTYYPFFQDVNVMIFVGFGFLMTFLHKYGFSSVGYNFVLAAFSVQIAVLFSGFWERVYEDIYVHPGHGFETRLEISIISMIKSLFTAAAVLISMGACLGKTTPTQLMVMAVFEIFFFAINETIVAGMLRAVDMGGSMVVHTFGAYFGLAVSRVISKAEIVVGADGKKEEKTHKDERSNKTSDMTAMIGTLFLWMFWPSFNGALAAADQQQRVAINTFLALSACACAAFLADNLMRPGRKFDMVSIQNATLAGGVAVGSSADLVIQPWGAITVGLVAGFVSVVGYIHLQPCLAKAIGLHDTCGVNNLHGMPGIIGGIGGSLSALLADYTTGQYVSETQIFGIFAARAPCQTNHSLPDFNQEPCGLTAAGQAANQVAALGVTLVLAIACGVVTGFIIKMPCLLPPGHTWGDYCNCGVALKREYWFDDKHYWEVPEEDEEEEEHHSPDGEPLVAKAEAGDVEAGEAQASTSNSSRAWE